MFLLHPYLLKNTGSDALAESMRSPSTADQQLCRRFTLSDIQLATADFSDEHVIGKGGFGKVYRALIDSGSVPVTVAIKRLSSSSNQGESEFATEMETLTKFRHHNLVSLIGYCDEEGEMILVYDYMVNGTLADHLYKFPAINGSSLPWNQRLKICIGAGRGLDYLHSSCSVIHRDVKSTNILLDGKFIAKVSDFGLAKRMGAGELESHVSTNVKGTFGYIDPSYFTSGRLTKASDTYAFGVVLLEVLTGKPAVGVNVAEDELCMSMWALDKIRKGNGEQIVAPSLRGEISESCLKTFVGVAKRCLHHEPKKRVAMTRAVAQLELALEQQERKGTATHMLQFWPFWSKENIASGTSDELILLYTNS